MANNKKRPHVPAEEIVREKTQDFVSRYANYAYLDSSMWDLRINFGKAETELGNTVPVDTQIIMPWPQVKVFLYFLNVHLSAYEAERGRIVIPPGIIGPPPSGSLPVVQKLFEEFIAANPDAIAK